MELQVEFNIIDNRTGVIEHTDIINYPSIYPDTDDVERIFSLIAYDIKQLTPIGVRWDVEVSYKGDKLLLRSSSIYANMFFFTVSIPILKEFEVTSKNISTFMDDLNGN